jgi:hypothetical protein
LTSIEEKTTSSVAKTGTEEDFFAFGPGGFGGDFERDFEGDFFEGV